MGKFGCHEERSRKGAETRRSEIRPEEMTKMRRPLFGLWIPLAVIVLTLLFVVSTLDVFRDCGYIDKNTGSRRGYREWCFGWKTGEWCRVSALESFMQEHYPKELQHKWICYQGDGKNFVGGVVSRGHGSPGPIIVFPEDMFDYCVRKSSDKENRELYGLLASEDREAIYAKLERMTRKWASRPDQNTTFHRDQ
jgi:hypothetical protein